MTPAPSPITKPSRSASNGRLARRGSSLRVDSARIAAKPPTPIGVIAASDPPAIITSASSRRMISNASPMACADAEQAVHVAEFGPLALNRMETWPAARLMMEAGMKNGEMRRGPPCMNAWCSRSMVPNPPMPDAMNTPTRVEMSSVTDNPASSIANCEAAMANWMKTSIFLTSFLSMNFSGSKLLDLAGDARGELRRIEMRDRPDAAASGAERIPVRLCAYSKRRHQADARDDDSPAQTPSAVRTLEIPDPRDPRSASVTSSCCATRCTRSLP